MILVLTRERPEGWEGYDRRVDATIPEEVAWAPDQKKHLCGPTGFVEAAANCLLDLGHLPESILTERFGPTG